MADLKGTTVNFKNDIGNEQLYSQATQLTRKKEFDKTVISQVPVKTDKTAQSQHDLEKPIWVGGKIQKEPFVGPGNFQQIAILRGANGVFVVKGSVPVVSLNTIDAKIAVKKARLLVTSGYFEQRIGGQALALKYTAKPSRKTLQPTSIADLVRVDLNNGNMLVGKQILETKGKLTKNVELYSNGKNYIIPVEDVNGGYSGVVMKSLVRRSTPESVLAEIKQLSSIVKIKTYTWPVAKPAAISTSVGSKKSVVEVAKTQNTGVQGEIINISPETKQPRFELNKTGDKTTVVQLYEHNGKFVVPLDANNTKGLVLNSRISGGFGVNLLKEINDKRKVTRIATTEVSNETKSVEKSFYNVGQSEVPTPFTTPAKQPS